MVADSKSMCFVTDTLKEFNNVVVTARRVAATQVAGVRGRVTAPDVEIDGEKFALFAHADTRHGSITQRLEKL